VVRAAKPWNFEGRFIRPSGEVIWFQGLSRPVRHGPEMVFNGIILDITSRKLAETALAESEKHYRTVFETTGTATVVIEKDGTIILANEEFVRLSGYSREEIENRKTWMSFVVREDRDRMIAQHTLRRTDSTEALTQYEFRFVTRNGDIRHILLTVNVIPGTTRSIASLLDITSRKMVEDALSQTNRQLTLLSSITRHDILNKVTIQAGLLALIEMDWTDNPEISEYIRRLKDVTNNIKNQIEFTRVYQDLGSHQPQWQGITGVLPQDPLPVRIHVGISADGIEIYADPLLEKVFFNLADNSLRHGDNITTIRVDCRQDGDRLLIVYEDDGKGIPAGEKERIFERGYGKNTGMGLFLAREILAITRISITETGEEGTGARFEISVPAGMWRKAGNISNSTVWIK
jgi:PAS domain S-box-containing protein